MRPAHPIGARFGGSGEGAILALSVDYHGASGALSDADMDTATHPARAIAVPG